MAGVRLLVAFSRCQVCDSEVAQGCYLIQPSSCPGGGCGTAETPPGMNTPPVQHHLLLQWCWLQRGETFASDQSQGRKKPKFKKRKQIQVDKLAFCPGVIYGGMHYLAREKSFPWNIKSVSFKNQSIFMFRIHALFDIRLGCLPQITGSQQVSYWYLLCCF